MSKKAYVIVLAVALVFSVSTLLLAAEPAVKGIEKPLPPITMPVYFLSGTDYEMGYQYGYQAAPYAAQFRDVQIGKFLSREYADTLKERDVVLEGFQYYVEKYAPYLIELVEGIADGMTDAGYPTSYAEALMMQIEWEGAIDPTDPATNYPSPVYELPECSGFCGWGATTTEGQLILGESADGGTLKPEGTIVVFPQAGNSYVGDVEIGNIGLNYFMNNKGLTIGMTASRSKRDVDNQFGLTFPFSFTRVIRFTNNATEARDMLLDTPMCWGTNMIVADPRGVAFVIEATSVAKKFREPGHIGEGDIDFLVNTNHFNIPEMLDLTGQKPSSDSVARYDLLFDFLQNNQGHVDLEFAKMMWRNPPVLRASSRIVRIGVTDGDSFLSYICTGPAYKVDEQGAQPIEPLYSFYEINLKDTPAEVTAAAELTARSYLGDAMTQMNKIDYTDSRYAPLKEIVQRARASWVEGKDHETSAKVTTGNEALFSYSKAVTAYTRAQALARHVYNELVPVALSPEDLK